MNKNNIPDIIEYEKLNKEKSRPRYPSRIMPQYSYKAKSGPGELKTGTITAENETAVVRKLKLDGLFPVSIEETNPAPRRKISRTISSRDISTFTRQLANLVHAGFCIARAMTTLIQQTQEPALKKLVQDLNEKIEKGATLSEALVTHPLLFSSFYISMAKIGEASGRIDETLQRLADFRKNTMSCLPRCARHWCIRHFCSLSGF